MTMKSPLPERVTVEVRGQTVLVGAAVNLCFMMAAKNHFNYFVFLDDNGTGEVRKRDYLAAFDEDRNAFMMDYVDPRLAFTGVIEATVLQKSDLEAAIRAYDLFRGAFAYPEGHRVRLESALALADERGELLAQMRVSVECSRG